MNRKPETECPATVHVAVDKGNPLCECQDPLIVTSPTQMTRFSEEDRHALNLAQPLTSLSSLSSLTSQYPPLSHLRQVYLPTLQASLRFYLPKEGFSSSASLESERTCLRLKFW